MCSTPFSEAENIYSVDLVHTHALLDQAIGTCSSRYGNKLTAHSSPSKQGSLLLSFIANVKRVLGASCSFQAPSFTSEASVHGWYVMYSVPHNYCKYRNIPRKNPVLARSPGRRRHAHKSIVSSRARDCRISLRSPNLCPLILTLYAVKRKD